MPMRLFPEASIPLWLARSAQVLFRLYGLLAGFCVDKSVLTAKHRGYQFLNVLVRYPPPHAGRTTPG